MKRTALVLGLMLLLSANGYSEIGVNLKGGVLNHGDVDAILGKVGLDAGVTFVPGIRPMMSLEVGRDLSSDFGKGTSNTDVTTIDVNLKLGYEFRKNYDTPNRYKLTPYMGVGYSWLQYEYNTTYSVDNSTIETDEKLRTYSLLLGLDYLQRVTKGFNIYGNIEIGKVLSSKIKVDDETYKTDKKLNYKVEFGMDFARRWNVGLFYERKEYGKVRDIGESIPRQDYMGVKIGFNFM